MIVESLLKAGILKSPPVIDNIREFISRLERFEVENIKGVTNIAEYVNAKVKETQEQIKGEINLSDLFNTVLSSVIIIGYSSKNRAPVSSRRIHLFQNGPFVRVNATGIRPYSVTTTWNNSLISWGKIIYDPHRDCQNEELIFETYKPGLWKEARLTRDTCNSETGLPKVTCTYNEAPNPPRSMI